MVTPLGAKQWTARGAACQGPSQDKSSVRQGDQSRQVIEIQITAFCEFQCTSVDFDPATDVVKEPFDGANATTRKSKNAGIAYDSIPAGCSVRFPCQMIQKWRCRIGR